LSNVQILYDSHDITESVIFSDASFEMQMNAAPGTCSFRVKDPAQSLQFVTGREIRLLIDDVPMWGGYLRRINMTYPFGADNTSDPENYRNRIWHLEGADYNILLDNIIIRNPNNYIGHVPNETGYGGESMDGTILWRMLYSFTDFPSGFDITSDRATATNIDNITTVLPATSTKNFFYKSQGTKIRDQFEELAKMAGAVFYIGAEKSVHWHAYENVQKRWGFSDDPNRVALTVSPDSYQSSSWPFHEVTGEEDGTLITNDAIIWGGSPLGSDGDIIVARYQDETEDWNETATSSIQSGAVVSGSSIYIHNRWQIGEIHSTESGYGVLNGVKARANTILNGSPGAAGNGLLKGLRYPQWTFSFSWWAHHVPTLLGTPNHIRAGDIIRIDLDAFGVGQFVPCRTIRISFPNLDADGNAYVLFAGDFSLSYTDPIALWTGVMKAATTAPTTVAQVTSVNNDSTVVVYGSFGTFTPAESPNGSRVLFTIPFGYIAGSLDAYLNGLIQRRGVDFTETSPTDGTLTFSSPPFSDDVIQIQCRTLTA